MDAARHLADSCDMNLGREGDDLKRALVAVVDDDESVRESLPDLLNEFGFVTHAFSSVEEFLASGSLEQTKCLILDIAMPGMTGLDLQQHLKDRERKIPIIFITAQKDGRVRDRAFEQGAVSFLFKPFSDTALLEALNKAVRD
jgi:FixJ family two-component response regulator